MKLENFLMPSSEDYQKLGSALVNYANESSNSAELHKSFAAGGVLDGALKAIEIQEKDLDLYKDSLAKMPKGSLTKAEKRAQAKKNKMEKNAIKKLRSGLGKLSKSILATGSELEKSKAVSKFAKVVEPEHELAGASAGPFAPKSLIKLREIASNIDSITKKLAGEDRDRVAVSSVPAAPPLASSSVGAGTGGGGKATATTSSIPAAPPLASSSVGAGTGGGGKATVVAKPVIKLKELKAVMVDPLKPMKPMKLMEPIVTEHIADDEASIPKAPPLVSTASSPVSVSVSAGGGKATVATPSIPAAPVLSKVSTSVNANRVAKGGGLEEMLLQAKEKMQKKKKAIVSKDHMNDKGERDFVYKQAERVKEVSNSGIMGALKDKIGSEDEINPNNVLDGHSEKDQMNMLYSAMIDGNTDLVKAFESHKTERDTGRIDDDWGDPIMKPGATFSEEVLEKVEQAVAETKARVEKGEHLPVPKAKEVPKAASSKALKFTGAESKASKPKWVESKASKPKWAGSRPSTASLMDKIRNTKLGSSKSKSGSDGLNMDGFTHIKTKDNPMAAITARRGAITGVDELADKLENMSSQKQLDTLYTAVIDGDKEKIQKIQKIQEIQGDEEYDVGVFTPEAVTKIRDAALKVAATQEVVKKTIIKKGIQSAEDAFKVKTSGPSKSQGR